MKCRICSGPAAVNMRQHKLALCREHYLEWVPAQAQRFIEKYEMFSPEEKILVAVSGGKDSLSLWDVLLRLGYNAEGLYINLGVGDGGYSDLSLGKAERFAQEKGVALRVVNIGETYGRSVPELARDKRRHKVCSLCGLVKRHVMNQMAVEGGFVLATGHNLDDEAAVLLENTLHWRAGYLGRQAPVLLSTHPGLSKKVKPFFRFYERETAAYAVLGGIDYVYDECPFATGATSIFYKGLLNRLEEGSRGAKLQFYLSFLKARDQGLFSQVREELRLGECQKCGQPTSAPGLCAFCRLWEPSSVGEEVGDAEEL